MTIQTKLLIARIKELDAIAICQCEGFETCAIDPCVACQALQGLNKLNKLSNQIMSKILNHEYELTQPNEDKKDE